MAQMNYRVLSQPYIGNEADMQDVLFPARTTTQLADVADSINTEDKFLGKVAFDTTLAQPVYASGATAAAAWLVGAISQNFADEASVGITGFAAAFGASVIRSGSLIKTTIFIDATGLEGGDAGDIIGDATPSVSHLGQFTVARNGTLFHGQITCLVTPAGGAADIDFTTADEDTGVQDTAIASLSNLNVLLNTGTWSEGVVFETITTLPVADQYLYMVDVAGDAVEISAGQFLLEFYGV